MLRIFIAVLFSSALVAGAYANDSYCVNMTPVSQSHIFDRLEIAANVGTTGLGVEVASPLTRWAKVRAGVDWMPSFTVPMHFGIQSYTDGQINGKYDRIKELMHSFTKTEMDDYVDMDSKPTMITFHFLVDVFPFQNNRHWHVTAGFYLGGNTMGKSINTMQEMPSLVVLNMYNSMYDYFVVPEDELIMKVIDNPMWGTIYLDPESALTIREKFIEYGELGVHIGDRRETDPETGEETLVPYMLHPDKDGTVSAKAFVNRFRPYLGFGYSGALSPDKKWQIGVEAGVQFWGGVPKVTTHEGVVLNDLVNLRGKVGTYMDLMKCIPVYPTIICRLSYTF